MKNEYLIKRASELGFEFFETQKTQDTNRTLAEAVLSRDPRFWTAFPAMLANAAEQGGFDPEEVAGYLPREKDTFRALMLMSAALYRQLGLRFTWAQAAIAGYARGALNDYIVKFKQGADIKIGTENLQPRVIKACFLTSFRKSEKHLVSAAQDMEQLGLENALSRIFPPKQKQLFLKKLRRDPMTKTEKEYFSRVIKKKAQALANADLHRLAIKALE